MIRALALLGALCGLAAGAAWLADNPGTITYTWREERGTLTTTEAAAVLAALIGAGVALLALGRRIVRLGTRRQTRRHGALHAAHEAGLLAIAAGDGKAAKAALAKAHRAGPDHGLTHLLAAQTGQLTGDDAGAEAAFEAMRRAEATRLVGLYGLATLADRRGDGAAALTHATAALAGGAGWAARMTLASAAAAGDYDAALAALETAGRALGAAEVKRLRLVLLTAKGFGEGDAARRAAKAAHRLDPAFVPAALALARKTPREAARILAHTFRRTPHPDLIAEHMAGATTAEDRLARVAALAALAPDHPESRLALARAALSARAPERAREALAPLLEGAPTERAMLLLAELEALAPGDEGRVRDALSRAVRAPKDPVWCADGVVADAWAPTSPVTGRLDAFVWQVPPALPPAARAPLDLPGQYPSLQPQAQRGSVPPTDTQRGQDKTP
ncbi:MAG: heme biosynthesis HemY N-terminal domain-containing protein [Pseudomonadota bacterium]